uniref:Uncharacterized protein n=1 Tax=Anguilla anguilla TaxID=7936 RepID=A0A0E9R2C4_ANGAN
MLLSFISLSTCHLIYSLY